MAEYPSDWNSRRKKVYQRDSYKCQNCGRKGGWKGNAELHAHHIVPKSKGGTHKMSNLKTMCKGCHNAIHGRRMAPSAKSESGGWGSLGGHAAVATLTGWWTLGAGNALYAAVSRTRSSSSEDPTLNDLRDDDPVRLGKSEKKGYFQKEVDKELNEETSGCPSCGQPGLTKSWIRVEGGKVKVVECENCKALFDPTGDDLQEVDGPEELEPTKSAVLSELFG
ncbi:HNH endonuclease [Halopelagius inordinatus]|uniref:HNH endonuclease n=2 Tax=Halopelagius inordinatus TaxID=553467 RepID=A0A1I2R9B0_9EURY|nr:HNH endonuclease [Halopelagius inordinatus]SFG35177.1 HNH endonuclease [Halopelagius inordinatus]